MDIVSIVIGAVLGLVIGSGILFLLVKKKFQKQADSLIEEAKAEAEVIKKDKILQA